MPVKAKLYTINNISKTILEWARLYGMDHISIRNRLRLGWDFKRAIEEPIRETRAGRKSARKKALLFDESVYDGKVHERCGTTRKYTLNGSCVSCGE